MKLIKKKQKNLQAKLTVNEEIQMFSTAKLTQKPNADK